jgi:hypothetical protein
MTPMFALRWTRLTGEFDAAFRTLAAARIAYEDQPRDPDTIAALGAARIRLDEARSAMRAERERLGLEEPWRVQAATTVGVDAPPLWSIDH